MVVPRIRLEHCKEPTVVNSKSPAWLVAAGVQVVLSSWSHHCTLRGLPPAPRANKNRSWVTTKPVQLVGAFVMAAASVPVSNCHSRSFPSLDEQATRYSPHVSIDHVVAGVTDPKSGLATP